MPYTPNVIILKAPLNPKNLNKLTIWVNLEQTSIPKRELKQEIYQVHILAQNLVENKGS